MKKQFEQWLLTLNCENLKKLGASEMASHLNDDLKIIKGNQAERQVLKGLVERFKSTR